METNPFLILEIPFDPPVNDLKTIDMIIKNKVEQWSRDTQLGIKKGQEAKHYLENIDKIKDVLFDDEKRKEAAIAAYKIHNARKDMRFRELIKSIRCVSQKGYITKKEQQAICNRYKEYYTKKEIDKHIPVPIKNDEELNKRAISELDSTVFEDIKSLLQVVDCETLYDFLEVQPGTSLILIKQVINDKRESLRTNAVTNTFFNAQKRLVDHATVIFESNEFRMKYQGSLQKIRLQEIDMCLKIAGAKKHITLEEHNYLIKQGLEVGLRIRDAEEYILDVCRKNRYSIEVDKKKSVSKMVQCQACYTLNDKRRFCRNCSGPLILKCPNCGKQNTSESQQCCRCAHIFTDMANARKVLSKAKQAYSDEDFDSAEFLTKKSLSLWPNLIEAKQFQEILEQAKDEDRDISLRFMKCLQEKRFKSAKMLLEDLISRVPNHVYKKYKSSIITNIKLAKQYVECAKNSDSCREVANMYRKALNQCKDYQEAINGVENTAIQVLDQIDVMLKNRSVQKVEEIIEEASLYWPRCNKLQIRKEALARKKKQQNQITVEKEKKQIKKQRQQEKEAAYRIFERNLRVCIKNKEFYKAKLLIDKAEHRLIPINIRAEVNSSVTKAQEFASKGYIHLCANQKMEAENYYKLALETCPDFTEAKNKISQIACWKSDIHSTTVKTQPIRGKWRVQQKKPHLFPYITIVAFFILVFVVMGKESFKDFSLKISKEKKQKALLQCIESVLKNQSNGSESIDLLLRKYPSAKKMLIQQLIREIQKINTTSEKIRLCQVVGQVCIEHNYLSYAGQVYFYAAKYSEPSRDKSSTWRKASEMYSKSIECFKQLGTQPELTAEALYNQASCFLSMNQHEKAELRFREAAQLYDEAKCITDAEKCRKYERYCQKF